MRRETRSVTVGSVTIGGNFPISIQSMTNTDTRDIDATVSQIKRLEESGCELVRVAVPDTEAAQAVKSIKSQIKIPLIADIHFDYRLAVESIRNGADKIRINPGNIGDTNKIRKVVDAANHAGIPIRVGVNSGSLEKDILNRYGGVTPEALVQSALNNAAVIEDMGFKDIVLSIKASDVSTTIAAYRLISEKTEHPLHIGITEAGTMFRGTIKSAVGLGALLAEGIGDTLRVSLTGDPVEEVRVGIEILKALGIRKQGIELISCPTCGRCRVNLIEIADRIEQALSNMTKPLKVAVMGCAVNGPGEARDADIGVACGDGCGLIFKEGNILRKVPEDRIVEELLEEIKHLVKGK